jgi:hypothetical protein
MEPIIVRSNTTNQVTGHIYTTKGGWFRAWNARSGICFGPIFSVVEAHYYAS